MRSRARVLLGWLRSTVMRCSRAAVGSMPAAPTCREDDFALDHPLLLNLAEGQGQLRVGLQVSRRMNGERWMPSCGFTGAQVSHTRPC